MVKKKPEKPLNNSGMDIPDYAIERIARCMLPMIQKYYASEEGKRELAAWEANRKEESFKTE